ncbi:MAG: argininosuccinate lyase [Candidatus Melainabacteria bacterium]|nr:argininosuccinate lyase [Candidatus Melainabacteria bacterium]
MAKKQSNLWSGRFKKKSAKLLSEFNDSLSFDKRLYKHDIKGSIAYAQALHKTKILTAKETKKIISGLNKIEKQIDSKKDKWFTENQNEDIHSSVENKLISLIGEPGRKLHTGRSRNDQVATDIRLYLKDELNQILLLLKKLRQAFITQAKKHYKTLMPGYTHLQRAQIITLGHHLLAYEQKFSRDIERFQDSFKRIDVMPLGSGALAGSSFNIDRRFLAKKLGFSKISENSIDAVSDRDFICEFLFNCSLSGIHLSQLGEEIILWSSEEFKFIEISDAYSTGSSMMPQKKNPDIAELLRGKTGRYLGNLVSILNVLKGLPHAYNKDLQEDKEVIFDSIDTIKVMLKISNELLQNISFKKDKMYLAAKDSFMAATDVADYLTKKGIPFRTAHEITGKIVLYCIKKKKQLTDLSIDEWKKFHKLFNNDIIEKIKVESCVNARNQYGGTAPAEVLKAIKRCSSK